jgi:glycosidase
LKGIPFIFQGQELGIIASKYEDISCFDDIESINAYEAFLKSGLTEKEAIVKINFGSRDNARRPMPWNGSEFGGFSTVEPWIAPSSNLQEINLEKDLQSEKSVFRFYQEMLKLRRGHAAFRQGRIRVVSKSEDNYFVFIRELGEERFIVICNFEQDTEIWDEDGIDWIAGKNRKAGELVLSNYALGGMKSEACGGSFRPYEIAVFRQQEKTKE